MLNEKHTSAVLEKPTASTGTLADFTVAGAMVNLRFRELHPPHRIQLFICHFDVAFR